MTSLTRGLALHVLLGVLQDKVRLAKILGRWPVTEKSDDGVTTTRWEGVAIRAEQHREIADAQLRDVLPRVLVGTEWNLTRALDAFLTAMAHYAVIEGATWAIGDPESEVPPGEERVDGVDVVVRLAEDVVTLLAALDDAIGVVTESPIIPVADGICYRALVSVDTLKRWAEAKAAVVPALKLFLLTHPIEGTTDATA